MVTGVASLTGGTVSTTQLVSATANYLVGDAATLVQGGLGSSYTGVDVVSGITGLALASGTATIGSTVDLLLGVVNDYVGGTLGSLGNSASLSGVDTALYVAATGRLGTVSNSGTLSGDLYGVRNLGTVGVVVNSGTISGATALYNGGVLGTVTNSGTIAGNIVNTSANALVLAGANGTAYGTFTGLAGAQGTIASTLANVVLAGGNLVLNDAVDVGTGTLVNSGAMVLLSSIVSVTGNYVQTAGTLAVAGHGLSVSDAAVVSGGVVDAGLAGATNYLVGDSATLISGGAGSNYSGATVTSGVTGLDVSGGTSGTSLLAVAANDYVGGTLASLGVTGTLANTAGGATALYIAASGTLGSLVNSGTISGTITNLSAHDLTVIGGGGLFTGGTIANTSSDVVFGSGAISLADAINVGNHTVSNAGANVTLVANVSVTGNYGQTAGTLAANGHVLSVSGAAGISGGVVDAGLTGTTNHLAGDSATLVSGGTGSSYAGATVVSGLGGLDVSGVTSGTNLLVVAGNDYIGGTLASLAVGGTLSNLAGGATALYIASTGSLGGLAVTGTIAGDIANHSGNELTITGGTDSAPGVLTGTNGSMGTITSSLANLRFSGGTVLLNDVINVGSHSVVNSGATLLVNSAVNITGSYSQTAGSLVIGVTSTSNYGSLVISGGASLTGGTVTLKATNGGSLSVGTYTIVSTGDGLSVSGVTFNAAGYTVTSSTVAVGGDTDLVLKVASASTNYAAVGAAQGGAAVGTGAALDRIAAGTSAAAQAVQTAVLTPLSTLSAAAKQVAVAQLSPSQLTPQVSTAVVTPTTSAISQHQQTVAGLMDGGTGAAAGSGGQQGAIWGEILGGGVLRGTTTDAAGYRASSAGLVLGADWFADPEVMAGLAFSWLNGAAVGQDVMAGSLTRVGSYQLTAYSVWRPDWADKRLSVDGQVGFGYNHYDQRRIIAFLGARANANYGGEQYLGKVTVGYDLPVASGLTLTPQYSLRAVRLTNHAYDEHDAGAADMAVGALKVDSLTQEVGAKLDTAFNTGLGRLAPDLRVAWVHDYLNGPIATTGALGGVSFVSTTGRPEADGVALGLGATLQQGEGVSLRLEYTGELRRSYQSHGGMLRATWAF
ncbi:MAG: autotransporter domain-containing protein [Azospirillaceae bacterium]|nr:autotransporter domain-containing protein [Azospirillaceae bacterium]